jgi:hypothetical protein
MRCTRLRAALHHIDLPRRERPRNRCAAKKRDELATPDANCHLIHPA